ncbi:MAG: flap endonuclease-1 [Nitrososphaera sp.]|uniref:Flap endonuclease 1 n=1 Tax=Nitrososphaera gargensis (strain Ga9.2) TaxID=1237085 RepID=K0ICB3_NITGG|nr:flap endonuclease-1 [Candidatus Nitrososphaera gargensis]AFU59021.1 flap structure-specific endonuclease [Candidatus Nitrososphaera gargensis Ga9.2]
MGLDLKPLVTPASLKLPELTGKVVAIDAYNTIYQFLSIIRGPTGEPLANSKGEITSHLSGLFYRNANLLGDNIKLVYVFDGKANELKMAEIQRRSQLKKEATEKYQLAVEEGRIEDARKYGIRTAVLTDKMVEESKKLLSYLGIPYIQAPSDGEAAAAYLTRRELAFAAASQDYDSILFGAKKLVRNLAISGKRKVPNRNVYIDVEPEIFEHDKVLQEIGLTHEQLIDVGILIGTDFNPGGFPGIGPKTALKLIKENGKLENVEKIKHLLPKMPYQEIRDIFLKPEVPKVDRIDFGEVNREKVLDFLCVDKSFSADRVSSTLDKLQKSIANRSQSLEQWFG